MKNTKPIGSYEDLSSYNKYLKAKKLPKYTIESVSIVNDHIILTSTNGEISLPLMQTMVEFVTEPKYCFAGISMLSRLDYSLLFSLAFPSDFQEKILKPTIKHLVLMDIEEIELGEAIYKYKPLKNRVTLSLKEYKGRQKVLYLPECVEEIAEEAFSSKKSPRKIISYSENLSIGSRAFYENTDLMTIETPHGVANIGDYSFACSDLKNIELKETMTKIPESAFRHCSIQHITLPKSLKVIESFAFTYSYISEIDFSACSNLERIDSDAFSHCNHLKIFDFSNTKVESPISDFLSYSPVEKIIYPKNYGKSLSIDYTDLEDYLQSISTDKLSIVNYPNLLIGKRLSRFLGKDANDWDREIFLADFIMFTIKANQEIHDLSINGMTLKEAMKVEKKHRVVI